jgi:glycosyltransferase involved in cell wall biosynthesis
MALISAFIITKNEEARIARAISSVQDVADEIIVVDSGSTDRTVDIAISMGAQVVYNEWNGYVKQKIFGESLCQHDWVLNIDADEEISEGLKHEIGYIFQSNIQDRYKAYRINVTIIHRSDTAPRKYAPCNSVIRLYNKAYAGFKNIKTTTHDAVLMNHGISDATDIYLLNEPAYHHSGTSVEQLVAKANFYSGEQAKDLISTHRKISNVRLVLEFLLCFLKAFFIRRYFVFGLDGFVDSMIFAFARFLRLAKARESNLSPTIQ